MNKHAKGWKHYQAKRERATISQALRLIARPLVLAVLKAIN